MIGFFVLFVSIVILLAQVNLDRAITALSPHILFQVYFIVQLPLNLFLGTNFYLPRFEMLSPMTRESDAAWLGFLIISAQMLFVAVVYLTALPAFLRPPDQIGWSRGRVNLVCSAALALGYLAFFALILMNGGFALFAETREAWRTSGITGQGWILFPATTAPAIAMCGILINNSHLFKGRVGIVRLAALYLLTVIPASQLGFRSLIFLPLLQAAYFYHLFVRRIRAWEIFSAGFLVLVAFTLYGIQREIPYNAAMGSYSDYLSYIEKTRPDLVYTTVLRSMGADIVQQVVVHMRIFSDYMKLVPSAVEAATIGIPSSLWPDKPLPLSVQFSRAVFGLDGGVSPTIVGEGYWHAGLIGVVILITIAGLLHAYFRSLELRSKTGKSSTLLMLSLYPSLIMMAESFQGYLNGIVLIAIANWLFRRAFGPANASPHWRSNAPLVGE